MAEFSSPTVRRVQEALVALGLGHEIVDLGKSARTAADAASAVGCTRSRLAGTVQRAGETSTTARAKAAVTSFVASAGSGTSAAAKTPCAARYR